MFAVLLAVVITRLPSFDVVAVSVSLVVAVYTVVVCGVLSALAVVLR